MENNSTILLGQTYRIEGELGSGGGGVVYKAWHTRLQKYVVIKELNQALGGDTEVQRNEVEALKNVKSKYLPQVLDFIVENGRVFTVMEFVNGESLDKLIESGRKFTQQQIVKWYGQLASALYTIHSNNIVHRDIKPANIMLLPNGDVCLIDFNAALVGGNNINLIGRSLGYASPEQYEIYEQRIHSSSGKAITADDGKTELVQEETEIATDATEIVSDIDKSERTELLSSQPADNIDWKLSDIYSLGATMYHLLTGSRPHQQAEKVTPVSKLGDYGEGIVYVIEKSMRLLPQERFLSSSELEQAIKGIYKHDIHWRIAQIKMLIAVVILPLFFMLFAGMTILGYNAIAQEREGNYYSAIYEIRNGDDPQSAYGEALSLSQDRIEPYEAMAERLWNDGSVEECRKYIQENLGNIAEFQNRQEAQRSFGGIYYILGNCYYYMSDSADYANARDCFATATEYVKDNPVYYRDYAIALARTGDVRQAERELEKAQVLGLDTDSLNLTNGEMYYAGQDYDSAAVCFDNVISSTDNDYVRYRAYIALDEIYKMSNDIDRSIELMSEALSRVPLNRVTQINLRLADAYVKKGDYDNAIAVYRGLAESSVPQFNVLQNLSLLLENTKRFDEAAEALDRMRSLFPKDYRVPMRQAYLEADIQSSRENTDSDYTLTKQYYNEALELYNENMRPGETDMEMEQLGQLIEQLKINHWIE